VGKNFAIQSGPAWSISTSAGPRSFNGRLYFSIAGGAPPCYPNCDGSTAAPVLNVGDFTCFLQKYAAGNAYANCDGSTQAPVLNVQDFSCFLQKYSLGCR
jgi:hypothetical protein